MNIPVRAGSGLKFENGVSRINITMGDGSTVDDLRVSLINQFPKFPFNKAVCVIGGDHVSLSTPLVDGQEISILLPISGG